MLQCKEEMIKMSINFKEEVFKRKDDLIADLTKIIKIMKIIITEQR